MPNGDDYERRNWLGQTLTDPNGGEWLVMERFRNGQGRTSYRCQNIATGKVAGFTAYLINRFMREGDAA